MFGLFMKKIFGNNEYRHWIKEVSELESKFERGNRRGEGGGRWGGGQGQGGEERRWEKRGQELGKIAKDFFTTFHNILQ